jgi:hypothetical protein
MHVAGTVCHCPLGSAVSIPEVPTEHLVGLNGRRLKNPTDKEAIPTSRALCPPSLRWEGGKVEASTRCCKELSAYCVATVLRMLFSRWYISPTPLVEVADNASRSMTIMATFWLALAMVGSCRSARSITAV